MTEDETREYQRKVWLYERKQSAFGEDAVCIANELCQQEKNVRMLTPGAMLSKLPGMTAQDKEQYLKILTQCDLLIVDDFGMERRNTLRSRFSL